MSAEETKNILERIASKLDKIVTPKEVQTVRIEKKRVTTYTEIKRQGAVVATTRPDTGQIIFTNEYDSPTKLIAMALVPDTSCKANGKIKINKNQTKFFESANAGDFTDIGTLNVPISQNGIDIKQRETIEIFMWTPSANPIALTVMCTFEVEYR